MRRPQSPAARALRTSAKFSPNCSGLLELHGPSGERFELQSGLRHRLAPGQYFVEFVGKGAFDQQSTDVDKYLEDCLANLSIEAAM